MPPPSPSASTAGLSALERLRALPRFGSGPGLHRMAALRDELLADGRPGPPPAIRITGSNGKGTVAHLTAALLREMGISTGLYTSPHFVRFEERFQIDGGSVSSDELEAAAVPVWAAVERFRVEHPDDEIAGFEALTALAFEIFRRRSPAVVVAEAGIGGRFDSTRVFEPGGVAALTSLENEHGSVLGATLLDIAYDKAELCPDGGVLVAGEIEPGIGRRLAGALALRGALWMPVEDSLIWTVREIAPERMRIDLEDRERELSLTDLELGVVGGHQAANAALAVQLVRAWLARTGRDRFSAGLAQAIRRAFATAKIAGRFQRIASERLWAGAAIGEGGPAVFVDVAHTPASLEALAHTVAGAFGSRPRVLVLGISQGRSPEMLEPVLAGAAAVVLTRSRFRGESAEGLLAAILRDDRVRPVKIAPSIEDALLEARALAEPLGPDAVVLVAGSYFLAAETAALAMGEDPAALGFPG